MSTVIIKYFLVSLFIGHTFSFRTKACNLKTKSPKKRLNVKKLIHCLLSQENIVRRIFELKKKLLEF